MITYRVCAHEEDDLYSTCVRVYVGEREYSFDVRSQGSGYVGCALNAAMSYSRSLGYGMRVLDAHEVEEVSSTGTHVYDITIAKKP